jgi:uncharacterized protein YdbL (DUF1318 family)
MMKTVKIIFCALALTLSGSVWALTIDEAKQQGRVGETLSGYLAAVKQDQETLDFVNRINQGRAQKYQELAEKNKIKVNDIAKMAGQKLVDRAAPGEYVRGINGLWTQK